MALKIEVLQREFAYQGVSLPDINPTWTPEQIRDLYSATYPEITTAAIEGPECKGDKLCYTFKRAVGTKGSVPLFFDRGQDGLTYIKVAPTGTPKTAVERLTDAAKELVNTTLDRIAYFVDNVLFRY